VINSRISALRAEMTNSGIDAYIIPLSDPHNSEYPATHWKGMEWISGFTGSAGTIMVTQGHAGLWTDSRYFIQGEQELEGTPITLHKMKVQAHPGYIDWCLSELPRGSTVGADGAMLSLSQKDKFIALLAKKDIKLKITDDFLNSVWEERPPIPVAEVFNHPISYNGEDRKSKISRVRAEMIDLEVDGHLITTLDDIAWLLNLRGRDVACNPVFVAYCLIDQEKTTLYINESKVPTALRVELAADGIHLSDYSSIASELAQVDYNLLVHRATLNVALHDAIGDEATIIYDKLISRHMKAIKNATEIGHLRNVHLKDGLALTQAFYWLEETLKERTVTEYEYAAKLAECRGEQDGYFGESFSAIVGYKGNGAIIHYRPEKEKSATISNEGILLVDSGGQYTDGTTDITRTITLSAAPHHQKMAYTRVLKGHIGLATAIFPEGTRGGQLDTLARKSLWDAGMNFGHGTGHGVGFFLNVHEPPQGFAPGLSGRAATIQKAGMFTSNEPGHYVADDYGIRIENLILTVKSEHEGFLEFETITYFPIDTQLLEFSLLTKKEVDWLNNYHRLVWEKLSPHLESPHKEWMKEKCKQV